MITAISESKYCLECKKLKAKKERYNVWCAKCLKNKVLTGRDMQKYIES